MKRFYGLKVTWLLTSSIYSLKITDFSQVLSYVKCYHCGLIDLAYPLPFSGTPYKEKQIRAYCHVFYFLRKRSTLSHLPMIPKTNEFTLNCHTGDGTTKPKLKSKASDCPLLKCYKKPAYKNKMYWRFLEESEST